MRLFRVVAFLLSVVEIVIANAQTNNTGANRPVVRTPAIAVGPPITAGTLLANSVFSLAQDNSSAIVVPAHSTMPVCDSSTGARAAICLIGKDQGFVGERVDGNRVQNSQSIYGAMVLGASDLRADSLDIFNVQGNVRYGGGLSLRDITGGELSNLNIHDDNSDGLNVWGSSSQVLIENLHSSRHGILPMDIENNGLRRPSMINLHGAILADGGAGNGSYIGADDSLADAVETMCGSAQHSCSNANFRVENSNRIALTNFSFRGSNTAGASQYPTGLTLDDDQVKGNRNHDIVVVGGNISNFYGDGISIGKPGFGEPASGTDRMTFIGINSTGNSGYGFNVANPKSNDNDAIILGSEFAHNGLGDIHNLDSLPTFALGFNLPFSTTNPPFWFKFNGTTLGKLDNLGNLSIAGALSSESGDLQLRSSNHSVDIYDGANPMNLGIYNGRNKAISLDGTSGSIDATSYKSGGMAGINKVVHLKSDDGGDCTLTITGGIITGTTCP